MLPLGTDLEADSYVVADLTLGAAGSGSESQEAALLPAGGTMTLLAIRATTQAGLATVTVTPSNGGTDGDDLTVDGVLVVANGGVLEALVAGGPRTVTIENTEATEATVSVLATLD
ncbi:hypothetical protein AVL62_13490 [Serinicoccus chungangensis]|uniref:Uncharacterized protein n=1 Tax=Serinicoccus chungangensis TaxID=767452 RepID=A0A0W8IBW8_9MICO|nr:hypothetical protein [Serinicoccus chungangensis]KUG57432.1 hypothetical protein AVL62_13490 [Serinicoccus chungangensis]